MKIEDAETTSIKNGKKVVGRLEERIRELVGQVDDEARRMAEAVKNLKKTERGVKECNYRAGEDSKNSERIKVGGNMEFPSSEPQLKRPGTINVDNNSGDSLD